MTTDSFFKLAFFPRKPYADRSEYPLFVRISIGGQRTEFKIGRSVDPANWDQTRNMCRGRSRRDQELNKYLELVRSRFFDIHNMLLRENKPINPAIMKAHFLGTMEQPKMLCEVFRETNEKRKEELDRGDIVKPTYQRWMRCVDYLEEFLKLHYKVADIPLKEVTSGMLDDFEHFLRMAHKWITDDPFFGKKYQRTYAERQFLTEKELAAVISLDLKDIPRLEVVRDTFVFCCFTGLAFCDVKTLKKTDITEDSGGCTWIRKPREKTGELSVIPLLDVPRQIAEKYADNPVVVSTGVVIPVITNQKMNAYLKEIADLAKIPKLLTTHVARHTFATMSLCNDVSIEVISKMLGHSDIKTTQIYAKMQDSAVQSGMEKMRRKFADVRIS